MTTVPLYPTPLSAAVMYGVMGWRVAPLAPGSKIPSITDWTNAATTDETTIRAWWESRPDAGVCIVTGRQTGLWVLDVDVANGKPGLKTLKALVADNGCTSLPETLVARTPSGGYHYFFTYPAHVDVHNSASNRLGPGLDVRGEGGQVNAAPTVRGEGCYRWVEGRGPCDTEVASAPPWLLELVQDDPKVVSMTPEAISAVRQGVESLRSVPDWVTRYNDENTWLGLLGADGWELHRIDANGVGYWVRPGKDPRDGISASTNYAGSDLLYVWTTSVTWLPSERAYDKYGYMTHRNHDGDFRAAAREFVVDTSTGEILTDLLSPTVPGAVPSEVPSVPGPSPTSDLLSPGGPSSVPAPVPSEESIIAQARMPVETAKFWASDGPDVDFLVEPFLVRARAHALFAEAKAGKSYVVLQALAAACVPGHTSWAEVPDEPITMLYLDYEMTEADLRDRLRTFGYGPDDDYSHFHYIKASILGADLDTRDGGVALLEQAQRWNCDLVVIDTMSRAVSGEENLSDTVRKFYQHTGRLLKAHGIAWLRLDHAGKDRERGQRGSSGKNDDVDIVWRLDRLDNHGAELVLTHSRVFSVEGTIALRGHENESGGVRHVRGLPGGDPPAGVAEKVAQWQLLKIPVNANRTTARAMGLSFKSTLWHYIKTAVVEEEERKILSESFGPLPGGDTGGPGDRGSGEKGTVPPFSHPTHLSVGGDRGGPLGGDAPEVVGFFEGGE